MPLPVFCNRVFLGLKVKVANYVRFPLFRRHSCCTVFVISQFSYHIVFHRCPPFCRRTVGTNPFASEDRSRQPSFFSSYP